MHYVRVFIPEVTYGAFYPGGTPHNGRLRAKGVPLLRSRSRCLPFLARKHSLHSEILYLLSPDCYVGIIVNISGQLVCFTVYILK